MGTSYQVYRVVLLDFDWCWKQIRTKFDKKKVVSSYQYRIKKEDRMYLENLADWIAISFEHFGKPGKLQVT